MLVPETEEVSSVAQQLRKRTTFDNHENAKRREKESEEKENRQHWVEGKKKEDAVELTVLQLQGGEQVA